MRRAIVIGSSSFDCPSIRALPGARSDAKDTSTRSSRIPRSGMRWTRQCSCSTHSRRHFRKNWVGSSRASALMMSSSCTSAATQSGSAVGKGHSDRRDTDEQNVALTALRYHSLHSLLQQYKRSRGIIVLDTCSSKSAVDLHRELSARGGAQQLMPESPRARGSASPGRAERKSWHSSGLVTGFSRACCCKLSSAGRALARPRSTSLPVTLSSLIKQRLMESADAQWLWPGFRAAGDVAGLYLSRNPDYSQSLQNRVDGGPGHNAIAGPLGAKLRKIIDDSCGVGEGATRSWQQWYRLHEIGRAVLEGRAPPGRRDGQDPHDQASAPGSRFPSSRPISSVQRPVNWLCGPLAAGLLRNALKAAAGLLFPSLLSLAVNVRQLRRPNGYFIVSSRHGVFRARGWKGGGARYELVPWALTEARPEDGRGGGDQPDESREAAPAANGRRASAAPGLPGGAAGLGLGHRSGRVYANDRLVLIWHNVVWGAREGLSMMSAGVLTWRRTLSTKRPARARRRSASQRLHHTLPDSALLAWPQLAP